MTSNKYFRSDIQGLRALAVSLVVIFHIWPSFLTGGFVGVDVFFVISGFLITKHLVSEVIQFGIVSFTKFWARRIRRLLPASYLVLFTSLCITTFLLPSNLWEQTFREITASAMYIENWALIANSVDYLAVENEPTLVQHFWSLSVEEQFYFVWPLLIILIVALANLSYANSKSKCANFADIKRNSIKYGLIVIFIVSLAYSVYATENLGSGQAYFSTATRAWEFSLGGLLIFVSDKASNCLSVSLSQTLHSTASWVGFSLIMISALYFSSDTNFPGYIALIPVFGTAIIILSPNEHKGWSFSALSRFYPVQFLGGVSYSAYLWHWPLIIICPLIFVDVSDPEIFGLIVIGLTIAFSWFSKKWVEDPFLRSELLIKKPSYSVLFALAGMFLILISVSLVSKINEARKATASVSIEQYSSVEEIQQELTQTLSSVSWPEIDQKPGRHAQVTEWTVDNCINVDANDSYSMNKCVYGNHKTEQTLVVIGDSWATHLLPAIRQALSSYWRIQVLTLGQCPIADVAVHQWGKKGEYLKCKQHRRDVIDWILSNKPSLIIASDSPVSTANRLMSKAKGKEAIEEIREGLLQTYQAINRAGVDVVHMESPPRITCFSEKLDNPTECKSSQSTIFQRQISESKISLANAMNFKVIDTTFWVCSSKLVCPNQIGNNLVKADSGHFTGKFSRKLGKVLRDQLLN